jgi:hypothetical protein
VQAPFYGIQMQMFIIVAAAVLALRRDPGSAADASDRRTGPAPAAAAAARLRPVT